MSKHSITEAKILLSDMIDRALRGERVVITRNGRAVVELKPISRAAKPITPEAARESACRPEKAARGCCRTCTQDAGRVVALSVYIDVNVIVPLFAADLSQ